MKKSIGFLLFFAGLYCLLRLFHIPSFSEKALNQAPLMDIHSIRSGIDLQDHQLVKLHGQVFHGASSRWAGLYQLQESGGAHIWVITRGHMPSDGQEILLWAVPKHLFRWSGGDIIVLVQADYRYPGDSPPGGVQTTL